MADDNEAGLIDGADVVNQAEWSQLLLLITWHHQMPLHEFSYSSSTRNTEGMKKKTSACL